MEVTRTNKNIYNITDNREIKPSVAAPRLSIRFINVGDDNVKLNSVLLEPGKEFIFTEGDGLTVDETVYRIDFEKLLANRNLLVIETYIIGFRNLRFKKQSA